jgi:hypothetical protein
LCLFLALAVWFAVSILIWRLSKLRHGRRKGRVVVS